jgi:hypothetical protein
MLSHIEQVSNQLISLASREFLGGFEQILREMEVVSNQLISLASRESGVAWYWWAIASHSGFQSINFPSE